ncbi:hypothetical protein [Fluviispira multicolorata]|uniref:Uncharacterized protein n=1 Tax=Fluviispira multicolorata TaxID=2654512 RepID=A0A833N656_9BACT|nr:hypothetical protein [Fluviispira multicolorata]KAB8032139.1 hypothetical protein GCL57_05695 [Fluviispira multicolorata]
MEKPSNSALKSYEDLTSKLSFRFSTTLAKSDFYIFYEKWINLHINLFCNLKIDSKDSILSEKELNDFSQKFMKKRSALVSSYTQIIKRENDSKKNFLLLKDFIYIHDENFKTILKQILDDFSNELIRLQSLRKATFAYTHSHISSGG